MWKWFRHNRIVAIALVLTFLISTLPSSTYAKEWTTFGGTTERQHFDGDAVGLPIVPRWGLDVGQSGSQPILVGNRIYHLAGDCLWVLRADAPKNASPDELVIRYVDGVNGGGYDDNCYNPQSVSSSHPTYDASTGVIYIGTGDGRVMAIDAESGQVLGKTAYLGGEVVSAPLVFPNDVVVVGSKSGNAYVIQGVASGKPAVVQRHFLGGWVTSSPVPINHNGKDGFIIGADAASGGGGLVKALLLNSTGGAMESLADVRTPNGVPASFAKEGQAIYFSDKNGTLYRQNFDGGRFREKWSTRVPGFINNSPAVWPTGPYVYFSMRTRDTTGKGALVAVNKETGVIAWTADLPDPTGTIASLKPMGNTAPLILGNPQVWVGPDAMNLSRMGWNTLPSTVLVGDTAGQVSGWYADTNWLKEPGPQQMSFSAWASGNYSPSSVIQATKSPYKDAVWWKGTSGVGTELTPAILQNGLRLVLIGVNEDSGGGMLGAWEMHPSANLNLVDARRPRENPAVEKRDDFTLGNFIRYPAGQEHYPPNTPFTVRVTEPVVAQKPGEPLVVPLAVWAVSNLSQEVTSLDWWWLSNPTNKQHIDNIALATVDPKSATNDTQPSPIELSVPSPDKDDVLVAVLNPTQTEPGNETTPFDNVLFIPVKPQVAVPPAPPVAETEIDLSISISAPREYRFAPPDVNPNPSYPVSMTVKNSSPNAVTTRVVLRKDGKNYFNEQVILPANGQKVIQAKVTPGMWNRTDQLEAVVDPDNRLREQNKANNRATAAVDILPPPETPGPAPDTDISYELTE